MENYIFLPLLLHITLADSAVVSIGGGGSVWIGGGGFSPLTPNNASPGTLTSTAAKSAYVALQAWKSAITDDPLGILRSWVGPNVCAYKGVFCADSQDYLGNPTGRVVVAAVDLNHAYLQGTLVKELAFLSDLSLLHLNTNRFSGSVPSSFRDLTSLTELDLSNNRLSGGFPAAVLYMPSLIYLDFRYNNFSGAIPEELFDRKLDAIFLNNNLFEGELPQNLGNSPASVINLANNRFSGTIPFSFSYMGIKEILFLNNRLTGCIPEGIGMWTDLQVLDVSYNSLAGHLPDSLSCLTGIEVLNLGNNRLSGELPNLLCSLKNLLNLTVAANFFSGFNQECDRLSIGFDFSFNCIPGRVMQRPQPQCTAIPGGGLSCLRIPTAKSLVCGTLLDVGVGVGIGIGVPPVVPSIP
ncbi:hypothetical protein M569_01507 [Genlisea aurea]|uniref:Cell wall hydroxyproline-rich glycoprotein n=1 Tax=Genlisea aurea TaxID=192259 RepID=S8D0E5_9LAMI|nr:hypothetical protein M569_01507 [Genlisea aurea]